MYLRHLETPVGRLLLAADGSGLRRIVFQDGRRRASPDPAWEHRDEPFEPVVAQLAEYFAGQRQRFDLALALEGTAFQLRVWDALTNIPYGHTVSYAQLAERIGQPTASRAVGLANGSNPFPIVVPCHRVIGANGSLTGYGGGLAIKQQLLDFERGARRLID